MRRRRLGLPNGSSLARWVRSPRPAASGSRPRTTRCQTPSSVRSQGGSDRRAPRRAPPAPSAPIHRRAALRRASNAQSACAARGHAAAAPAAARRQRRSARRQPERAPPPSAQVRRRRAAAARRARPPPARGQRCRPSDLVKRSSCLSASCFASTAPPRLARRTRQTRASRAGRGSTPSRSGWQPPQGHVCLCHAATASLRGAAATPAARSGACAYKSGGKRVAGRSADRVAASTSARSAAGSARAAVCRRVHIQRERQVGGGRKRAPAAVSARLCTLVPSRAHGRRLADAQVTSSLHRAAVGATAHAARPAGARPFAGRRAAASDRATARSVHRLVRRRRRERRAAGGTLCSLRSNCVRGADRQVVLKLAPSSRRSTTEGRTTTAPPPAARPRERVGAHKDVVFGLAGVSPRSATRVACANQACSARHKRSSRFVESTTMSSVRSSDSMADGILSEYRQSVAARRSRRIAPCGAISRSACRATAAPGTRSALQIVRHRCTGVNDVNDEL